MAHYDGTGQEIVDALAAIGKKVDMVVLGAGTGGTITGVSAKLKFNNPSCIVVGVDPHGSILAQPETLNDKMDYTYQVEGIGYDFIPGVLDRKFVDKWYKVDDPLCFETARQVIREEGILCGGSSGGAMWAAIQACKDFNFGPDKNVVVLFPDSIRNYMSKFLDDDWLKSKSVKA